MEALESSRGDPEVLAELPDEIVAVIEARLKCNFGDVQVGVEQEFSRPLNPQVQ